MRSAKGKTWFVLLGMFSTVGLGAIPEIVHDWTLHGPGGRYVIAVREHLWAEVFFGPMQVPLSRDQLSMIFFVVLASTWLVVALVRNRRSDKLAMEIEHL